MKGRLRDMALATALFAFDVFGFWAPAPWLWIALGAGAPLALCWRRVHPRAVFFIVWAHTVGLLAFMPVPGPRPTFVMLLALYTVAAYSTKLWSFVGLAASVVPAALYIWRETKLAEPGHGIDALAATGVFYLVVYLATWAIARLRAQHRVFVLESQRREEAEAFLAVAAERNRIAAELHDIVAHSVTVMVLQAAGARGKDISPETDRALTNIEQAGQQAMVELRRLLKLVQEGEQRTFQPAPGVHQIGGLVEVIRSAGPSVELHQEGPPAELTPSVDLAAYRVVQEALTNVAKHAGAHAHAVVTMRWETDHLVIEVRDNGRCEPVVAALSTGHGLSKLRERVQSACGTLSAGPVGDGGFLVKATLPTQRGDGADDDPGVGGG
ncbi:two-component sensor histidine kinase [Lentzea sp. NBRC 105346]|uniref:sensor histidine kinase n=1 Tax=Lentzea sp. NBRC 105346 TaxID=3032205 RepID=UPI00249FE3AE|nr:histidine kinase [Lentzea sp. NBRC 105346]GLZ34948.1 two-component sensor histidine kinase [Lentzea sp. NBRC 105346]